MTSGEEEPRCLPTGRARAIDLRHHLAASGASRGPDRLRHRAVPGPQPGGLPGRGHHPDRAVRLRPVENPVRAAVRPPGGHGYRGVVGTAQLGPAVPVEAGAARRAGFRHHLDEPVGGQRPAEGGRYRLPDAPRRHGHSWPRFWAHIGIDQHVRRGLHARSPGCRLDRAQRIARAGDGVIPIPHLLVHQSGPVVVPPSPGRRRAGPAHSAGPGPAHGPAPARLFGAGPLRAGR